MTPQVVGVDLGTTNSAIAYVERGKGGRPVARCIPNAEGSPMTPSVVSFLPHGEVLVGQAAKKEAPRNPRNTFSSTKRLIGRKFQDPAVQEEVPRLNFKVCCVDCRLICHNAQLLSSAWWTASLSVAAFLFTWPPGMHATPPVLTSAQVMSDDKGEVSLECSAVGRGFIYPEEVAAQVCVSHFRVISTSFCGQGFM
jgi:hypothetical protein